MISVQARKVTPRSFVPSRPGASRPRPGALNLLEPDSDLAKSVGLRQTFDFTNNQGSESAAETDIKEVEALGVLWQ